LKGQKSNQLLTQAFADVYASNHVFRDFKLTLQQQQNVKDATERFILSQVQKIK